MRSIVATLLVIAGCGRVHFDPLTGGDGSVGDSADGAGLDAAVTWPAFGTPQLSTVSTAYDDWTPELSRNGLMLFGGAYGAPGGVGQDDLWMSTRASVADAFNAWSFIPNLGTAGRDFGPAISPDGLTIFYGSGGTGFSEPPAIFVATRPSLASAFTGPAEVTTLTGGSVTRDPGISADRLTMYFDSDRTPSMGGHDIWYATRATPTSSWSTPINLTEVNTAATDRDPFISSDGLTLYFASNRSGGIGVQDLWVTIRPNPQAAFAPPRNVTALNTPQSEGNPSISDDGLIIWDTTRPGGPGGTFGYDLWEARLVPQ